ncbi:hypothetical protein MASR2M36_33340 [Providencia sp.]
MMKFHRANGGLFLRLSAGYRNQSQVKKLVKLPFGVNTFKKNNEGRSVYI